MSQNLCFCMLPGPMVANAILSIILNCQFVILVFHACVAWEMWLGENTVCFLQGCWMYSFSFEESGPEMMYIIIMCSSECFVWWLHRQKHECRHLLTWRNKKLWINFFGSSLVCFDVQRGLCGLTTLEMQQAMFLGHSFLKCLSANSKWNEV